MAECANPCKFAVPYQPNMKTGSETRLAAVYPLYSIGQLLCALTFSGCPLPCAHVKNPKECVDFKPKQPRQSGTIKPQTTT